MKTIDLFMIIAAASWLLVLITGFIWKHHIDIPDKTAIQEQRERFWTKTLVRTLVAAMLCTGVLIYLTLLQPQVL